MSDQRKNWRARGMTLVECLVALSVLMVGILVIFDVSSVSYIGLSGAPNNYLAMETGREKMESWVQQGYSWVTSQPSSVNGASTVTNQVGGTSKSVTFNWTVSHHAAIVGGVEEVDVSVNWSQKGAGGMYANSVTLATWVSR